MDYLQDNKNLERGVQYEIQMKHYLETLYPNGCVYLWKDVPINDLIELNLIKDTLGIQDKLHGLMDIGCDIIIKNNKKFIFVQCKNYTDKDVCMADIKTFGIFVATLWNVTGLLLTNTNISKNLQKLFAADNRVTHLKVSYKEPNLKLFDHNAIDNKLNPIIPIENIKLTPRQYQLDAYHALKNLKRAIIQMICGMGKTYISIMLSQNYDNIIILSPLKGFAEQTLNIYKKELTGRNYILIDSEGTRDVSKIILGSKNIISATFRSADVVLKIIDKLANVCNCR